MWRIFASKEAKAGSSKTTADSATLCLDGYSWTPKERLLNPPYKQLGGNFVSHWVFSMGLLT